MITVKRDKTIKIAMDSKVVNKAVHKNKYHMQNIDCLMDNISQSVSESRTNVKYFSQQSTYDTRIANYR